MVIFIVASIFCLLIYGKHYIIFYKYKYSSLV